MFDLETLPEPDDEEFAAQDWDSVFAEQHREVVSPVADDDELDLPAVVARDRRPASRIERPVPDPEPAWADARRRAASALSRGRDRLRALQGRVPQGVPVPRPPRPEPPPAALPRPPKREAPVARTAPPPREPELPEPEPVEPEAIEPEAPDVDLFPDAERPQERDLPPEPSAPVRPPRSFDPFESTTASAARRPGDRLRLPSAAGRGRSGRREPPQPPLRVTGPGLEHVSSSRRVLAIIALIAAGVAVWFLVSLFQPFKGSGSGNVVVTVPKGSGASQIGKLLEQRDVVSSQFFFSLRAGLAGKRGELRSGRFVLKHGMSYGAALDALTKTPAAPRLAKITIPEGRSRREIVAHHQVGAACAAATSPRPRRRPCSSRATTARRRGTRRSRASCSRRRTSSSLGAPASELVAQQLRAFRRNFAQARPAHGQAPNLNRYDVIIDRLDDRARGRRSPKERPLIAAVIYNRLRERMPLGIDATIRYALNNWTQPLQGVRARRRDGLQHAHAPGPAADADRQPRPGVDPGRGPPGAACRTCTTSSSRAATAPTRSRSTDAKFQRDVAAYNARASAARRQDPTQLLSR